MLITQLRSYDGNGVAHVDTSEDVGDDPLSRVVEREMDQRGTDCSCSAGHEHSSLPRVVEREEDEQQADCSYSAGSEYSSWS